MNTHLPRSTRLLVSLVQPSSTRIFVRGLRSKPQTRPSSPLSQVAPSKNPPNTDQNVIDHSTPQTPNAPQDAAAALANLAPENNSLLAPVHIPEDKNAVIRSDHPATNILAQSGLVVQRQIEMMNIFLGFEQANRYVILDPQGNHVGYIAEHDGGFGKVMGRQWFRTHRSFTAHVFDRHQKEVLRFHRPFSWINSTIRVYDPLEAASNLPVSSSTSLTTSANNVNIEDMQQISQMPLEAMRIIGEAHSEWAPLRRKYHLFLAHDPSVGSSEPTPIATEDAPSYLSQGQIEQVKKINPQSNDVHFSQFAYINEPFLSWDFSLLGGDQKLLGSVNRSFRGFAREIFTDTGAYVLRMDSAGLEEEAQKRHIVSQTAQGEKAYAETVGGVDDRKGMTLDQRAVMLATAVTVDFDYFSRHSHSGGMGFMPLWMGGGGEAAGGAAGGAAGAGAGEAAGAAGGAVVGSAGRAVGGAAGAGEGAIAGAGTMAGYEAMQRGMGRDQSGSEASPQAQPPPPDAPADQSYGASPYDSQSPQSGSGEGDQGDVWGQGQDPWDTSDQGGSGAPSGGGDGEGGGGIFSQLWDSFFGD